MGSGVKGKCSRAKKKNKVGGTWLEVARDRFESRGGRESGKGKGLVPEELTDYVAQVVRKLTRPAPSNCGAPAFPPEEASEKEPLEFVATATASSVYRAALDTHRMCTGRRASGFEPQRNTFYVLGRPIQVCMTTKTSPFSLCLGFQCGSTMLWCCRHSQQSMNLDSVLLGAICDENMLRCFAYHVACGSACRCWC